jgi:tRNA pseudouridine38-40 synthase
MDSSPPAIKFRLVIAYDGTNYAGWQVQKIGLGVQEKVEEALKRFFSSGPRLHGSSRTDTGVHALGMVAHFEVPKPDLKMPVAKLTLALNAFLPPDIRVMSARRCRSDFHARFDATGKQYRYQVWNHPAMNPLLNKQAWHVPQKLDWKAMRSAARLLEGRHDFKTFAGTRSYEMESTVRTVTRCHLQRRGALLTFIIEGDGFLYKMCRGIVGTLVQLGRGRFDEAGLRRMIAARNRQEGGMTAPAHGLFLCQVFYSARRAKRALRPLAN